MFKESFQRSNTLYSTNQLKGDYSGSFKEITLGTAEFRSGSRRSPHYTTVHPCTNIRLSIVGVYAPNIQQAEFWEYLQTKLNVALDENMELLSDLNGLYFRSF